MTAQKIFNALQEILVETQHVPAETITLETRLEADLHMDSLDQAEVMLHAENALKIPLAVAETVDDAAASGVETVGDVVKLFLKNYEKYNS